MGWTGEYKTAFAAHKDVLEDFQTSEDFKVLGHRRVPDDRMWIALKNNNNGERFVVVVLADKAEEGAYYQKVISEDMEPFFYDCPQELLRKTAPGVSITWRKQLSVSA